METVVEFLKRIARPAFGAATVLLVFLAWIFWQAFQADNLGFASRTVWDWLELLLIPISLAVASFWMANFLRDVGLEISQSGKESDRAIALDRQRQEILEKYLDKMQVLLLDKGNRLETEPRVRKLARALSLRALRELEAQRTRQVIRFLHDCDILGEGKAVDLARADLFRADLEEANLNGHYLFRINLREANLRQIYLQWANLEKANLRGASLAGATLYGVNLREANLREANLRDANMKGANLRKANLNQAILSGADLTGAYLRETRLIAADLSETRLRRAYLQRANLERANLRGANLRGAIMLRAQLPGADLAAAILSGANLTGANLNATRLSGADLSAANLSGAFVSEEQLEAARLSDDTIMPDGEDYRLWQFKREHTQQRMQERLESETNTPGADETRQGAPPREGQEQTATSDDAG